VNPQAVDRIRKILRERAEPPKKKPSTPALGLSNPYGLLPIHLRSELLPQLSVEDQVFCERSGARNIIRRRELDLRKHKPVFANQEPGPVPPRRSNRFVDDTAIESDGEGGDIPSSVTTPQPSRPPSPDRLPPIKKTIEKPKCYSCNKTFSGPKQLDIHLKSKKHWKQVRNTSTLCITCGRFFSSKHNLRTHKCSNFLKNEPFYKFKN